jgi:hypothetical protein
MAVLTEQSDPQRIVNRSSVASPSRLTLSFEQRRLVVDVQPVTGTETATVTLAPLRCIRTACQCGAADRRDVGLNQHADEPGSEPHPRTAVASMTG